jgi:hypothetical protein
VRFDQPIVAGDLDQPASGLPQPFLGGRYQRSADALASTFLGNLQDRDPADRSGAMNWRHNMQAAKPDYAIRAHRHKLGAVAFPELRDPIAYRIDRHFVPEVGDE